jgi:hypothetical protein
VIWPLSYVPNYNYWRQSGIFQKGRNKNFTRIHGLDTRLYIYRYTSSQAEVKFIKERRMVFSTNHYGTYWTTLLTDDPGEAQRLLALPRRPTHRVGGITIVSVDHRMIKYQGKVKVNNRQPGGAWELVITAPIMITSLCDIRQAQPQFILPCIL